MYPYYRAGLCLCGVFRLCLLWPFTIAVLWSAGGDICGVYGIYSVDIWPLNVRANTMINLWVTTVDYQGPYILVHWYSTVCIGVLQGFLIPLYLAAVSAQQDTVELQWARSAHKFPQYGRRSRNRHQIPTNYFGTKMISIGQNWW